MKQNCWEYKKCGREPGGQKSEKLGVCPATMNNNFHGVNQGKNAGRICWAITGTLCQRSIGGVFAKSIKSCMICDFLIEVRDEEEPNFRLVVPQEGIKHF